MPDLWWSTASRLASVTATPVLQLATDGRWDTARVLPMTPGARSIVHRFAHTARTDLAVEILWPAQAFVGASWPVAAWPGVAAAITRVHTVLAGPRPPGRTLESALLALLGGAPGPDPEFAELGAVNAWWSVGPEPLWQHPHHRHLQRAQSNPRWEPHISAARLAARATSTASSGRSGTRNDT